MYIPTTTLVQSRGPQRGARVTQTGTQAISTATFTPVLFPTETYDTDAFHSTVSNTERITVPASLGGYYLVLGQVRWDNITTGTYRRLRIRQDGVTVLQETMMAAPGGTGYAAQGISTIVNLTVGAYVELVVDHDRGTDLSLRGDFATLTFEAALLGT
jgi:hypothetical protein